MMIRSWDQREMITHFLDKHDVAYETALNSQS